MYQNKDNSAQYDPAALSDEPTKVTTLALVSWLKNAIEMLLKSHTEQHFIMVPEAQAEICIIDKDAVNAAEAEQTFLRHNPKGLFVYLSIQEQSDVQSPVVKKPVKIDDLVSALELQRRCYAEQRAAAEAPSPSPTPEPQTLETSSATPEAQTLETLNPSAEPESSVHEPAVAASARQGAPAAAAQATALEALTDIEPEVDEEPLIDSDDTVQLTQFEVPDEADNEVFVTDLDITAEFQALNTGEAPRESSDNLFLVLDSAPSDEEEAQDAPQAIQGEDSRELYFKPQQCFLGQLQAAYHLAQQKSRPIQFSGGQDTITINPKMRKVATSLSDSQLRSMCLVPLETLHLEMNTLRFGKSLLIDWSVKSLADLDEFIWKIALWSAQGRLPEGTDLDAVVYLQQWPNLTRLSKTPHATRIAAFWLDRPCSLRETVSRLGLEQADVFNFYTAVSYLGLLGDAPSVQRKKATAEQKPRSLFGSLLRALRKR